MDKTFMFSRCDLIVTVRMGLSELRKQAKCLWYYVCLVISMKEDSAVILVHDK